MKEKQKGKNDEKSKEKAVGRGTDIFSDSFHSTLKKNLPFSDERLPHEDAANVSVVGKEREKYARTSHCQNDAISNSLTSSAKITSPLS